jgi:hypothetical protein
MKIRKELDKDKLLSLCKFLESVLTDEEISELAGMLLGGLIASALVYPAITKKFKGEKNRETTQIGKRS